MTTSHQLLVSLAQYLGELGVAHYLPPPGVYVENPALPAVIVGDDLPPSPDTAVALEVYNDLRDRDPWNPDYYVRMRWRAAGLDPQSVNDFADRTFDLIHTAEPGDRIAWPGGVTVLTCLRVVRAKSAPDANGRFMRADSYRITLNPGV